MPQVTYYERYIFMSRILARISIITLAFSIIGTGSSSAWWMLDYTETQLRLQNEGVTHTNANSYFEVSVDEFTNMPQEGDKVAIVNPGGVIERIVTYNQNIDISTVYAVILPENNGVLYADADGTIRLEAINQGDIISVRTSQGTQTLNDKINFHEIPALAPTPISGVPTPFADASTITAVTISSNSSISFVIVPPTARVNTSVSVQVVTDGRSHTSVGSDNLGSPVTINDIPANSNVTVQTTVVNNVTGEVTITQNPIVSTPQVSISTPAPARDHAVDLVTISSPVVTSSGAGTNGHRSANIEVPVIPNFDASKTNVQLVIRDITGATTAMGLSGDGGVVSVDWLSPTQAYDIQVVVRDLGTGHETSIAGNRLP